VCTLLLVLSSVSNLLYIFIKFVIYIYIYIYIYIQQRFS
jgi:hypothetical protein